VEEAGEHGGGWRLESVEEAGETTLYLGFLWTDMV